MNKLEAATALAEAVRADVTPAPYHHRVKLRAALAAYDAAEGEFVSFADSFADIGLAQRISPTDEVRALRAEVAELRAWKEAHPPQRAGLA